jgi:threonine dehydrogenase-like Zn-dependent dehydrogenase
MKAVVFHGPGKVSIEDRPIPQLKEEGDIIVKVDKVRLVYQLLFGANTL